MIRRLLIAAGAATFFTDESDAVAKPEPTRRDPGHAQSWGQIPKEERDVLTTEGLQPGTSCNPNRSGGGV